MLANSKENMLYAVYDLGQTAITYDVFTFLALAEIERQDKGLECVQLVFVPGKEEYYRADQFDYFSRDALDWRVQQILMKAPNLFPGVKGTLLFASRDEGAEFLSNRENIFPVGYTVENPVAQYFWKNIVHNWLAGKKIPQCQANDVVLSLIDKWHEQVSNGKPLISITLRESSYGASGRNSNLKEWAKFIRAWEDKYQFVVLRDFEKVYDPLPEFFSECLIYQEAVVMLDLRMALYERCCLNMMNCSGPNLLPMLSRTTPYLIFNMHVPDSPCTTLEFLFRVHGIIENESHCIASPHQKLVWDKDVFDVLDREFREMVCRVEDEGPLSHADVAKYVELRRQAWLADNRIDTFYKDALKTYDIMTAIRLHQEWVAHCQTIPGEYSRCLAISLKLVLALGEITRSSHAEHVINILKNQSTFLEESSELRRVLAKAYLLNGNIFEAQKFLPSENACTVWEQKLSQALPEAAVPLYNRGIKGVRADSENAELIKMMFRCCSCEEEFEFLLNPETFKETSFLCPTCLEYFRVDRTGVFDKIQGHVQ